MMLRATVSTAMSANRVMPHIQLFAVNPKGTDTDSMVHIVTVLSGVA